MSPHLLVLLPSWNSDLRPTLNMECLYCMSCIKAARFAQAALLLAACRPGYCACFGPQKMRALIVEQCNRVRRALC
jgi:hypothetical protein